MCRFKVSVMPTSPSETELAVGKFGSMPYVTSIETLPACVTAQVDHPGSLNQIGAAAWAKDLFGIHRNMIPSVSRVT